MIGDKSFSSPNIFVTKPYFQWRNISSPNVFFFSNFNRLGDKVLRHQLFFFFFFSFNRSNDELFRHQFLLIVIYGNENYRHQFYFFINILYIYLPLTCSFLTKSIKPNIHSFLTKSIKANIHSFLTKSIKKTSIQSKNAIKMFTK